MTYIKGRGHFPPRKTRQTLLSFAPHSVAQNPQEQQRSRPNSLENASSSIPAPSLPQEIWKQILDPLETLALKTFRLVCQEWSEIGAPHLYSTVYLNRYEKCWSGLIAISKSRYSTLVKRIVWNPLLLMEECLDGGIWKAHYPNLLRGLSHEETLRFYEAFVAVYRNRNSFLRSSSIESISEALKSLYNCCEVVLSDDCDLETSCLDHYLRAGIQKNPDILYRPTTWCLSPRMWKQTPENQEALKTVPEVLSTLQICPSVTSMVMDFWVAHWFPIPGILLPYSGDRLGSNLTYPSVKYLKLGLKFCVLPQLDLDQPSMEFATQYLCTFTKSFPELQELIIEPSFVDPGKEFMDFTRQQYHNDSPDDESDSHSTFSSVLTNALADPASTASLLMAMHACKYDLPESMLKSTYVDLCPRFVQLPNLRKLALCNLSVDARLLLSWLCVQRQLPASQLTLHLRGTTVIFGLAQEFFHGALANLNVDILYDPHNSSYYFPLLDDGFSNYYEVPHLEIAFAKGKHLPEQDHWIHEVDHDLDLWNQLPAHMPEHPFLEPHHFWQVEIASRPNNFEDLIREHEKCEREVSFYTYQARLGENEIVWEWVDGLPQNRASDFQGGSKQSVPLIGLTIRPFVTYYEDYWGDRGEIAQEESQGQVQAEEQEDDKEQQLLMQYETELLGLDLVEDGASQ